ncbi:MAG TPA: acylphosphatase [Alphaproteobacteria bacterium]|nr:acylphosphatase [Alphaproteobacteria bacterium]
MKEVYLKISGRVQGVGFRRWAERTAKSISGISGWVRNVDDGTVEILMKGEEKNVEQMVLACQKGPIFARVDNVSFLPGVRNYFLPPIVDGVFEHI